MWVWISVVFVAELQYTPMGCTIEHMVKAQESSKKKIIRRLKIVEGQIRGLQEMVDTDTYCTDIITQSSAAKQGLSTIEDLLMEQHLARCVVKQILEGKPTIAVNEVLKVYKLKRK